MPAQAATSSSNGGGGGAGKGVGPSRRTWDLDEYAQKARDRDREEKERAQENEERMRKGKAPLARRRQELPKPTESLQARKAPLDLEKNVGKTLMVDSSTDSGRKGPGYYCELCRRTCKDSIGYLDHINGRSHLRRLGQTTQVQRSTVEQVRARLATLLEEKRRKDEQRGLMGGTLEYDFQARVKQIAEKEEAARQERKRRKQEERDRRAAAATAKANAARAGGGGGDVGGSAADEEMMKMMGFGGFGSSKK